MNREKAIKATKNGAIAAVIAAVSKLVFLVAIIFLAEDRLSAWYDLWYLLPDVGFLLLCAFGMHKQSRAAAITVFIYYLLKIPMTVIEFQTVAAIGLSIVFLYFFGKAVQGSIVFHKLEKQNNPDYKSTPTWLIITGSIFGVLFLGLIALGLLDDYGYVDLDQPGAEAFNRLTLSINNAHTWDAQSIWGYQEFFTNVKYISLRENETLKVTDDTFLLELSQFHGQCVTRYLMVNHDNPSDLLLSIKNQDLELYEEMSEIQNNCHSESMNTQ